ncbi:probable serine/threonine-protein kinase PIX13 [Lotus japonicus]|uniref:probable serine/threonine-protein kinase PIX13 n=1 Tax=Lotus japonicus TaxID=34305 RepID=UPI002589CD4C|nr:probable serine/threonine-protein kinase PIX13 [Lotus japonicus]
MIAALSLVSPAFLVPREVIRKCYVLKPATQFQPLPGSTLPFSSPEPSLLRSSTRRRSPSPTELLVYGVDASEVVLVAEAQDLGVELRGLGEVELIRIGGCHEVLELLGEAEGADEVLEKLSGSVEVGELGGQSCHINASGSNQFRSDLSNTTTSNNTNTSSSLWDSENSQIIRDQDEFPCGRILDVANLRVFTLAEMKAATKNFSSNTVLGEGGFGTVYKGYIKDKTTTNRGHGLTIAVKKLNPKSSQGLKEWQTEVNFLGRLSHPYLVKLLGFGGEDSELFLVYEFLHRGSLDNHLFGRSANVRQLSWDTRLKVMLEAARGLAFLHSLEKNIIHRDLKTSNILLDKKYTVRSPTLARDRA